MLSLMRYVVAAVVVQLVLVTQGVAVEAAAPADSFATASENAKVANGRLRGLLNTITGSSEQVAETATPPPVKEIVSKWTQSSALEPVEKINGDEAIVVFYDKETSPIESAIVTYDVRSQVNCVVSVCGLQSNWYSVRSFEKCYDLRIAQRSLDASEHGLIRGISAAYSALRPVASKLYLKFDATNFIDGSACQYEILSGSKTVTQDAVAVTM
ncbi:hypothetical protein FI667_g7412, partial [Globisporangium splendens]